MRNTGRHERTRTADPYRVKVVLYQLSYVPKGSETRSRVVYFGEEPKVTNGRLQCQERKPFHSALADLETDESLEDK